MHLPGAKRLRFQNRNHRRDVVFESLYLENLQRRNQLVYRSLACRRVRDHLGDHRVVMRRHVAALGKTGFHAHRFIHRRAEDIEFARRGEKILRVFGVDARLYGVTLDLDLVRQNIRKFFAGGSAYLRAHEINAGDLLGDAVLDLQARIHFEKIKRTVRAHQHLDGADVVVAQLSHDAGDLFGHGHGFVARNQRSRRLLDHLLITPLRRAIALE